MNDWEGMPTAFTIEQFAYRMYLAQRTADVNMSAQRTPVMVVCSDKQRLTMENLYSQYDGNQPFIFGDKDSNINENSLKSLKLMHLLFVIKLLIIKKKSGTNSFNF